MDEEGGEEVVAAPVGCCCCDETDDVDGRREPLLEPAALPASSSPRCPSVERLRLPERLASRRSREGDVNLGVAVAAVDEEKEEEREREGVEGA